MLVGTLSYAKGQFAFFDGSDPGFKQVLEPGASIGGCVVTAIAFKQVTLKSGGVEFELPVGARLLREDPGQWKFGGKAELVSPTVETVAQKSQPPDSTSSGQSAKTAAALAAEVDEYDKWAAKKLSKYLAGGSSEPKKDKQWGKISRAFNEDAPRKPEKPRKRDQG